MPSLPPEIPDFEKTNLKVHDTSRSWDESDFHHYVSSQKDRTSRHNHSLRHYHFHSAEIDNQACTVFGLNLLVTVSVRYRTAVTYRYNRLTHKRERYDGGLAAELQRVQTKKAVKILDRAFNGKDLISAIN